MNQRELERYIKYWFESEKLVSAYSKPSIKVSEEKVFKKHMARKGKILDIFCGAGRVAIPLAKRGYQVIGVDNNEKMIEIAKKNTVKRKINVKFVCMDASEISFENKFDYVIAMSNSL